MKSLVAACLFLTAASLFSYKTEPYLTAEIPASQPSDPLFLALGNAKEAIGDTLFIKADEYFHGGVIEKEHHDESAEDIAREGLLSPDQKNDKARSADWIERVNAQVRATQEKHLSKEERKEMLPFFKWATDLDPHNVEAVLTTAYWLESEFKNRADAALLLQKGIKENPDSWELERDLARWHVRGGDAPGAEPFFRRAVLKSESLPLEKFERVTLCYEWGQSAEAAGLRSEALGAYRKASRAFEDEKTKRLKDLILARIKELSV